MGVAQYSPLTARALQPDGDQKLKGVTLHHFGAFVQGPGARTTTSGGASTAPS